MKTKQEQINEIVKYICNVCDFKCAWFDRNGEADDCTSCPLAQETAEAIYNAIYKQLPDSLQLTSDYHRYKKGFEKACKLLSRYMDFEIPEIQEKLLSMAEEEI